MKTYTIKVTIATAKNDDSIGQETRIYEIDNMPDDSELDTIFGGINGVVKDIQKNKK